MLFNSLQFLVFFPTVVAVFFLIPHRFRWIFLLSASYYFYMAWKPEYAILILASTLISYVTALLMERFGFDFRRQLLLYTALIGNLGILFFFKYFNFFSESFGALLNNFDIFYNSPTFSLLLPIGISFYTFQSLSYIIDVYRGTRAPERHLGIFALYVSFFPQLVAGPIERSTRLLPQFFKKVTFNAARLTSGLRLMLWGYFLKLVIADNSGLIVDTVYNDPTSYGGLALLTATFFFSLQIFGDFAGYSYIAIGAARIMGFDLMTNFRRPYLAASIGDFWRRWHISLMTWFRDYIYIPLGGSRISKLKWIRNIAIVFLISGLWHGASWTFVIWGALNAFYIIFSKYSQPARNFFVGLIRLDRVPIVHRVLQIFTTFLLTMFAWIFFRADTLSESLFIIQSIISDYHIMLFQLTHIETFKQIIISLGIPDKIQFLGFIVAVLILIVVQIIQEYGRLKEYLDKSPVWLRWSLYYGVILFIVFFGYFGAAPFIYFQF